MCSETSCFPLFLPDEARPLSPTFRITAEHSPGVFNTTRGRIFPRAAPFWTSQQLWVHSHGPLWFWPFDNWAQHKFSKSSSNWIYFFLWSMSPFSEMICHSSEHSRNYFGWYVSPVISPHKKLRVLPCFLFLFFEINDELHEVQTVLDPALCSPSL